MKPLHDMIQNYKKRTRGPLLVWSEERSKAFHQMIIIEKNNTMYFSRDDCPIYLQTDASQFGIGAYCFQLLDNKEQPIAFVSKSLSQPQFNGAIIQKEAYAIFYSLRNLKGILRDRHVTIQTDSRGLSLEPTQTLWSIDG
jgi:uncharacterized protein YbaR (Trm112 family)